MNISLFQSGRHFALALTAAGLLGLAGCCCNPTEPPPAPAPAHPDGSGPAHPATAKAGGGAAPVDQKVFASPEEAAGVLKDAAAAGDRQMLLAIFGPEGQELVFSGDPVEEENGMKKFAAHLAEYAHVVPETADKAVLYIGLKNWPFPIPLVKGAKGWFFDTAAGKEELLNRRIGGNELNAIAVCRAYVVAQKAYISKNRTGDKVAHYALHFRSSEGKKDGLYWPAGENEEISPMGPLVAQAQGEGYLKNPPDGQRHPYKGYFFHILTAQGAAAQGGKQSYLVDGLLVKGFAMIAWPDSWGASGVMTFLVNQDGKVMQKNLGEKTGEIAKEMSEYNPDGTWEEVKD